MRVEVVVVGNELLNGDLADTNTARIATFLRARGLRVHRGQTVPDEPQAIIDGLELAARRADLVLITGGLGPTEDDLTVSAAAQWAGVEMREDPRQLSRIRERFESRGYPFTPNNARQALVPAGATSLDNPVGTAPAVRMEIQRTEGDGAATLFFFPGVPLELARLLDEHLDPWLARHAPLRPLVSHIFHTFGKTESAVAGLLDPLARDPRLHVAYRAHFPEIQVSLHVEDDDPQAAGDLLGRVAGQARELLGPIVYSEDGSETFAQAIARLNAQRRAPLTFASAESCTGGLVAAMITEVPGVSAWFQEGAVTYSNAAKIARLGVSPALIEEHGAVSEPVARAMAEGCRVRAGVDVAVAITGIAGPGGGSAEKPVGTVHLAIATPDGTEHRLRRLPFGRERTRIVSAWAALDMFRRYLVATSA